MSNLTQIDYLTPTNFKFIVNGYESTMYTGRGVNLPDLSLSGIEYAARRTDAQLADNKLLWSPLAFNFIVDDEMNNYKEMFDWMNRVVDTDDAHLSEVRNATLIIYDRDFNAVREIEFIGCWPTNLGGMQFDYIDDQTVMICGVSMEYDYFRFVK